MLSGYTTREKCTKCGKEWIPIGFNIRFVLKLLADGLGVSYQDLTPSLLAELSTVGIPSKSASGRTEYSHFFPKGLTIEEAKLLLDNQDKSI